MRIVFLNPVGILGGAERVLLNVLAALREASPSLELHLLVATEGPLAGQAEQLGVSVAVLPMPALLTELGDFQWQGCGRARAVWNLASRGTAIGWAAWRYARRLRQHLAMLHPAAIHSNGIKFHLLTRLAVPNGIPVVWHLHDFLSARPLMARGLRWAAKRASGIIAISQAVAQDAQAVLGPVPVQVVYNAIDTNVFTPKPGDEGWLDRQAGLPPAMAGTIRVGLVATYARWKGQEVFLQAAARLLSEQPDAPVRFYLVGGPIYRTHGSQFSESELRAKAAELGITQHVGFVGFQQDTANIYRALDLVVHASTQPEPFGLTIAEAMACAKPVIIAQAGGAAELFTPDHNAVGVPPGDAAALAAKIKELLHDPRRRQQLGEQARHTAVQRFSRARLGPEILAAYRRFFPFSSKWISPRHQH